MLKFKVKSSYRVDAISKMRKVVDEKFVSDFQAEVINNTIKPLIAAGVSPVDSVDGGRRFAGYKDPNKYPNKRKAKRPVSLWLTGLMLSFYKAKKVSGSRLQLGIPTDAPYEVKVRAEANNVGTVNSDGLVAIAARRFIPLKGESFRISVVRKIKDLYAKRIKTLLSTK